MVPEPQRDFGYTAPEALLGMPLGAVLALSIKESRSPGLSTESLKEVPKSFCDRIAATEPETGSTWSPNPRSTITDIAGPIEAYSVAYSDPDDGIYHLSVQASPSSTVHRSSIVLGLSLQEGDNHVFVGRVVAGNSWFIEGDPLLIEWCQYVLDLALAKRPAHSV